MSSFRYIFRARNPEQGVQYVTVEHDKADDADGAFIKLIAKFRMRDREYVQHFATQEMVDDETIKVSLASGDVIREWKCVFDPTPRPTHYIPPAVKIATNAYLDAKMADAPSDLEKAKRIMESNCDASNMTFHKDGKVTNINVKDCIWVRCIDIKPNDVIILEGEGRLVDSVNFRALTVKVEVITKGKTYNFTDASHPVLVHRLGKSTSRKHIVQSILARNAGNYRWVIADEGMFQMAHKVHLLECHGDGTFKLTLARYDGERHAIRFTKNGMINALIFDAD